MSRLGKILVGPSEHIIRSKSSWSGNVNSTWEKIADLLRTSRSRPLAPLDYHKANPNSGQGIRLESSPYFKIDQIFWNKRLELFKTIRSANPHSDTRQNTKRWNRTFSVLSYCFFYKHLSGRRVNRSERNPMIWTRTSNQIVANGKFISRGSNVPTLVLNRLVPNRSSTLRAFAIPLLRMAFGPLSRELPQIDWKQLGWVRFFGIPIIYSWFSEKFPPKCLLGHFNGRYLSPGCRNVAGKPRNGVFRSSRYGFKKILTKNIKKQARYIILKNLTFKKKCQIRFRRWVRSLSTTDFSKIHMNCFAKKTRSSLVSNFQNAGKVVAVLETLIWARKSRDCDS